MENDTWLMKGVKLEAIAEEAINEFCIGRVVQLAK